jgi:hypothetical protein
MVVNVSSIQIILKSNSLTFAVDGGSVKNDYLASLNMVVLRSLNKVTLKNYHGLSSLSQHLMSVLLNWPRTQFFFREDGWFCYQNGKGVLCRLTENGVLEPTHVLVHLFFS